MFSDRAVLQSGKSNIAFRKYHEAAQERFPRPFRVDCLKMQPFHQEFKSRTANGNQSSGLAEIEGIKNCVIQSQRKQSTQEKEELFMQHIQQDDYCPDIAIAAQKISRQPNGINIMLYEPDTSSLQDSHTLGFSQTRAVRHGLEIGTSPPLLEFVSDARARTSTFSNIQPVSYAPFSEILQYKLLPDIDQADSRLCPGLLFENHRSIEKANREVFGSWEVFESPETAPRIKDNVQIGVADVADHRALVRDTSWRYNIGHRKASSVSTTSHSAIEACDSTLSDYSLCSNMSTSEDQKSIQHAVISQPQQIELLPVNGGRTTTIMRSRFFLQEPIVECYDSPRMRDPIRQLFDLNVAGLERLVEEIQSQLQRALRTMKLRSEKNSTLERTETDSIGVSSAYNKPSFSSICSRCMLSVHNVHDEESMDLGHGKASWSTYQQLRSLNGVPKEYEKSGLLSCDREEGGEAQFLAKGPNYSDSMPPRIIPASKRSPPQTTHQGLSIMHNVGALTSEDQMRMQNDIEKLIEGLESACKHHLILTDTIQSLRRECAALTFSVRSVQNERDVLAEIRKQNEHEIDKMVKGYKKMKRQYEKMLVLHGKDCRMQSTQRPVFRSLREELGEIHSIVQQMYRSEIENPETNSKAIDDIQSSEHTVRSDPAEEGANGISNQSAPPGLLQPPAKASGQPEAKGRKARSLLRMMCCRN